MNDVGNNEAHRLLSIIERVERLEEERKALAEDIKDVFLEAKSSGYDVPALKALIKERKEDVSKRDEREAIIDVYRRALGSLLDTPLGRAAMERI